MSSAKCRPFCSGSGVRVSRTPRRKSCYDANFFVIGCAGRCRNDNPHRRQCRQSFDHGNSCFQCESYESNNRCATPGNLCAITDGYILPGRLAKSAAWHLAQCEMGAWLGTPGGLTRLTSWLAAIRLDDTGPQCLLDGAWGPWVGGKLHSANASYLDNQHWGRRRPLKRVLRHHWRHWISTPPPYIGDICESQWRPFCQS